MKRPTPPRKPLTAFFMFREKQKEKGITMGGKEAGEKWAGLSSAEKKVYEDAYKKAKEKYDKYLEEVEGIAPQSSKKTEKPTHFNVARVRAVCTHAPSSLQMPHAIYRALGNVLVP